MRRADVFVLFLVACGRSEFEQSSTTQLPDAHVPDVAFDATIDAPPPPWAALAPVGYYPFDGNSNDLAYAPGTFTCPSCTYGPGYRGMAVKIEAQPLPTRPLATADFTMAAWIYVPDLFPGALAGCPTIYTAAGGIESDDEPARVMLYGFSYSPASSGVVDVNADAWTHVAMTHVAATGAMRLFVDAVDRNGTTVTVADSLDDARLSAGVCNVMIDELFLFDRVLTAGELATIRDLVD